MNQPAVQWPSAELPLPLTPRPQIRHVLFDFDGTLSLIRQGWPEVMVGMFVEMLPRLASDTDESLESLVLDDIMRLNGKQTIYQMMQLADRVRERGGEPREPLWYKHEYLRRLSIAKLDYEHLRAELARRFPGERFLLVRYGDHQPMATRMLLGFDDGTEAEDVAIDRNSIGFITFFAVNGVNFAPERYTSPPILDVPYLGTVLLEASGLPLSDAYKGRQRLKELCAGHSFDCPRRDLVLDFHRQLLDAGLVSAR